MATADADKKAAKPKATKPPAEPKNDAEKKERVKKQYVLPHEKGWQVKLEGSSKATKTFKTKAEAEEYAKSLAKNQGTSVMRQKKDHTFQKKR